MSLWIKLAVAAAALASLLGLYHWWAGEIRDEGRREVRAEWDADKAKRAMALVQERMRQDEARKEADREAKVNAERAATARAAADDAARRLQHAAAAVAARAGACPAAVAGGASAPAAADLLADVQRRLDEAAGVLAAEADRRRNAGLQCQREHAIAEGSP